MSDIRIHALCPYCMTMDGIRVEEVLHATHGYCDMCDDGTGTPAPDVCYVSVPADSSLTIRRAGIMRTLLALKRVLAAC